MAITLTNLQSFVINGLINTESQIPNSFVWNGLTYPCISTITDFKRELVTGGYTMDKLLTLTVRLYDALGNALFTSLPTSQNKISFNGVVYRIDALKLDATNTHFRLVCFSAERGQHG